MNNAVDQWSEFFNYFQIMNPAHINTLERLTFVAPDYGINIVNIDEFLQVFRMIMGGESDMKVFDDFPYVKSNLANFKKVQVLMLKQMNIMLELTFNTLDYMQKSGDILEKTLFLIQKSPQ